MRQTLNQQIHLPSGWLGHIVGWLLQVMRSQRNAWAADLLALQTNDRVLEIGCGPGVAVAHAAQKAGHVTGIDPSDVMVQQARARNAAAVKAGRVVIELASAEDLPLPDSSVDKAFAVNTFHHWVDRQRGLAEVLRVLRAGGLLVIVEQPVPGRDPQPEANMAAMQDAGFVDTAERVLTDGDGFLSATLGYVPR